jgi:hypothetical protein
VIPVEERTPVEARTESIDFDEKIGRVVVLTQKDKPQVIPSISFLFILYFFFFFYFLFFYFSLSFIFQECWVCL